MGSAVRPGRDRAAVCPSVPDVAMIARVLGDDVSFAGVAGQAQLVTRGELCARELVETALARIERLNGELNAFGAVYPERARADADRADQRRSRGESAPLLGVPIAVKDEIDLAGAATSRGTGALRARASTDAEVVRRLREAVRSWLARR